MYAIVREHILAYFNQRNFQTINLINCVFLLFFMISDSVDVYIPLYYSKMETFTALKYGTFISATFVLRLMVIMLLGQVNLVLKKRIIYFVVVLSLAFNGCFIMLDTKVMFFIAFGFMVVMRSAINTVFNPLLASLCKKENLGIVFGTRDIFLSIGSVIGLSLVGFIECLSNQKGVMLYFCSILLVLLFCISRCTFYGKRNEILNDTKHKDNCTFHKMNNNNHAWKEFILYMVMNLFLLFGIGIYAYIPILATDVGLGKSIIFQLYSGSALLASALSFFGGILIDRYNKKNIYYLYIVLCFFIVLCLKLQSTWGIMVGLFLLGIKTVLDNIEQVYFFAFFRNRDVYKLWSLNSSINLGAGVILPILVGKLLDININSAILLSLAFILIALILCKFLGNEGVDCDNE